MSDHIVEDGSFINSIVGEGTRFRGELDLNGLLRIDGDYSGTIRTPGKVLVGKNGRAECMIYAGTVVVGGVIKGDVYSTEKVIVLSTGMVIGNIYAPRLIVEEGVIVNGEYRINKEYGTQKETEQSEAEQRETISYEDSEASRPAAEETAEARVEEVSPDTAANENGQAEAEESTVRETKEISAWNG
jgi:cytoskeletal protein CcmA (bactofilin family)